MSTYVNFYFQPFIFSLLFSAAFLSVLVHANCALPASGIFPGVFYYGSKETSEVWSVPQILPEIHLIRYFSASANYFEPKSNLMDS